MNCDIDQKLAEILKAMRQYADVHQIPILKQESARFLQELIQKHHPAKILEIGTAIGYSALIMLQANSLRGIIVTVEIDPERANIAREFFEQMSVGDKIKLLVDDANMVVPQLDDKFDFIFLDGPKSHYLQQLRGVENNLLPGGIVVADNVSLWGMVEGGEVVPRRHKTMVRKMREYLFYVRNPQSGYDTQVYSFGGGIAVSRKMK